MTKRHTVQKGDTLWSIAKEHLGSGFKFWKIYWHNYKVIRYQQMIRGHWVFDITPHRIYPGMILEIPEDDDGGH